MLIGITLGDVTGIGPEVTLKALAKEASSDDAQSLIIGDADCVRRTNEQLQLKLTVGDYRDKNSSARISVYNPQPESLSADLVPGSPAAARAAVSWVKEAAD